MPSLLDLSAELQLLILEYLNTPAIVYDAPAVYFAPKPSQDVANLSVCCQSLRKLAAPTLYRTVRLHNNHKSECSIKAVSESPLAASLVRELNFEGSITIDDEMERRTSPGFSSIVEGVLSHLNRFSNLAILTVHFKLGENEEEDERETVRNFETWIWGSDPYHSFGELKHIEDATEWRALMARTYDAISSSELPCALRTLELRNLLPSGVSSFTTEAWRVLLRNLKTLRLSLHPSNKYGVWRFNVARNYIDFIENLDILFSHLASITEFRFAASTGGLPGLSGTRHAVLPLKIEDLPLLQFFELQLCFISERTAHFIASHSRSLKRVALEDCYSAVNCGMANEHTSWATFFSIIADSIEIAGGSALEDFFVSPRTLGKGHDPEYSDKSSRSVPIDGEDQDIELARQVSKSDPRRRPFDYATVDDKYGMLFKDERQNLTAFLEGQDQAAFDRLMSLVTRQTCGRQRPV